MAAGPRVRHPRRRAWRSRWSRSGISALCAWSVWRVGHRVGDAVSGHGPDADRIADGERDWTVPIAASLFTAGYLVVAIVTACVAATAGDRPVARRRVVVWSFLLSAAFGWAGIATGSGRLAIWATVVPPWLRAAFAGGLRILGAFLVVSTAVFLLALALDFGTAANVMSRLHTGAGDATVYTVLTATLVPNAGIFAGSYLLGPGFLVGTGTVVSPALVSLGPVPMFPLLAALPDNGPTPAWASYLLVVPPLLAAVAAAWAQRRTPTVRWEEGALRGCVGGVTAGLLLGVLAAVVRRRRGSRPDARRRTGRDGRDGARRDRLRPRRRRRRAGDDLVAAPPRPPRRAPRLRRVSTPSRPPSSSSCRAPAPTSRR